MVKSWLANILQLIIWLREKWFLLLPGVVLLLLIFGFSPWAGLDSIYGLPIFQISGWSLVFIIPLAFLVLGTAWLQLSLAKTEFPRAELTSAFIFFGAGLLFLSSQNALALLLAWGLLDLGFLWVMARSGEALPDLSRRAVLWNLLGMLGWLVFAFSGLGGPWVLLALWVRLGIYPAMQILSALQLIAWPTRAILRVVAITAGGYLLTRYPVVTLEGIPQVIALNITLLAMAWGILSLWREGDTDKAGLYIYQVQLGFFLLVVLSGLTLPPAVAFLAILSMIWGWILFETASRTSLSTAYPWLNLAPLAIAVTTWMGLPFTPGFAPRLWVYNSLLLEGKIWLVAAGAVSLILVFPPLAKTVSALSAQKSGSVAPRHARIWLWVLVLFTFLLGVYPDPLLSLAGTVESPITPWGLVQSLPPQLLLWLTLLALAPPPIGYFILRRGLWPKTGERPLETAYSILSLEWLYPVLESAEGRLENILRRVAAFGEGRGAWGWVIFLVLLVLLWVIEG